MADKNKTNQKKDDAANDAVNDKKAGASAGADDAADTGKEPDAAKPKTYTEAEYQAALKKAQKDADKKIADAEAKAKLSDDERKDKELADAQAALLERDTRDEVIAAAEKAGVKNPRLFYNAYKSELERDNAGKVTNLKDVLEAAKTEAAELFTSVEKPQGGADAGTGNNKPATLTKEAIDKMTPTEIANNMEAIDAFLATQK